MAVSVPRRLINEDWHGSRCQPAVARLRELTLIAAQGSLKARHRVGNSGRGSNRR